MLVLYNDGDLLTIMTSGIERCPLSTGGGGTRSSYL